MICIVSFIELLSYQSDIHLHSTVQWIYYISYYKIPANRPLFGSCFEDYTLTLDASSNVHEFSIVR